MKLYVGSTITAFRTRLNNHKSSMKRYERGERGIPGEHLYAHFFEEGHAGLADVEVMIVDRTNVNDPAGKRRFLGVQIRYLYPEGIEYKRL